MQKIATVFGGTGFVGRHIIRRLAKVGYTVKVATRAAERAYFLRPYGTPGTIVPIVCDYSDSASIAAAIEHANIVINCIGTLAPRGKNGFTRTHVEIPRNIAAASREAGVARLIHISSLSAGRGESRYARSKGEGEGAVRQEFPAAIILRPSVIFGPEDNFFNMFAELSRFTPALPLIGGDTKFQPVYVGDVADAVMAVIHEPDAAGRTFELGGPDIVTFRDIYQQVFSATGRRRCLIRLPFGIAKIQAAFLQMLPHPVLTVDQVETLKSDNIVSPGALTLASLGISAKSMDGIVPGYLEYSRTGGKFADKKRA
ncbi:MAG TPA: complex I NDUFA9 subunit family protein [Alphaproteobacteria bacterium]